MYLWGKPWRYMNEGNVHIVIELIDTEYVLRLIKDEGKTITYDDIEQSQNFVSLVMLPLLTKNFVVKEEILVIGTDDLHQLCQDLLPFRPEKRQFKYHLIKFAIKTSNLALLSPKCDVNYCIEIKPKQGFIPSSLLDHAKCYFCLKQYVKLQHNHIKTTSGYCPLNLFSGEKQRMKHALLSLVDNPQNNFKIFRDGNLIYDETSNRADFNDIIKNICCFNTVYMFLEFIIEILLNDNGNLCIFDLKNNDKDVPKIDNNKCIDNTKLNNKSFLYKLLQLQKLSETLAIHVKDIKIRDIEYLPILLQQIKTHNLNLSFGKDKQMFFKITDPLHLAIISAVARDCSLMISFSPNSIEEFSFIQIGDDRISYKLSVTDLEPKSVQTLIKRKDAERKMIDIYKTYVEKEQDKSSPTQKQEPSN